MKSILIVDDHKLIHEGLKSNFAHGSLLEYASTIDEALTLLNRRTFDIAIVDISLGGESGFSLLPHLPRTTTVFILSMHKSSYYVQKAVQEGARGYFLKDEPLERLLEAVNNPLRKNFWLSSSLKEELDRNCINIDSKYESLSSREQQIFAMLAKGLGYKEIAYKLGISSKTVNNHRDKIMRKMEISNMAELIKEAIRLGIVIL